MQKKVAVVAVHGMGSFAPDQNAKAAEPGFSAELHSKVRKILGKADFDANIAWREVYYSDILDKNQTALMKRIEPQVSLDWIRKFVIANLGDPASYYSRPKDKNNTIYPAIHARIDKVIAELEGEVRAGRPLVILAHSFGGYVMSNHIWDRHDETTLTGMAAMKQVAAFVTFGCNIPIFTFAYDFDHLESIKDPGTALENKFRLRPWWRNFYDRNDPLGFPLATNGRGHAKLSKDGELADTEIDAGGLFTSWNAFSHSQYWGDADLVNPVAVVLKTLMLA